MQQLIRNVGVLVGSLLFCSGTAADGLLYQLPSDGAWCEFDMKVTAKDENPRMEKVIMRSVGKSGDDQGSRWIEFNVPHEDTKQVVKVLIPERFLKEGEAPLDRALRGWRKIGDEAPVSMSRPRDFWLLIFLAGPLHDTKKLEPVEIDTPLGKLKCDGVSGRASVTEDDGYQEDLSYEIRRHKSAPFGVVRCRIDCVVKRDGKMVGHVTYDLQIAGAGKDARTEMPGFE